MAEPHVERMKEEHEDLAERTEKLGCFFSSPTYQDLSRDDRLLLCEQHAAMERYKGILEQRIERAGE